MESPIKCVVLRDQVVLISEIFPKNPEEMENSIEWELTKPFQIKKSGTEIYLEPWLCDYTDKTFFTIYSDVILTITDPNKEHLKKYIDLTS